MGEQAMLLLAGSRFLMPPLLAVNAPQQKPRGGQVGQSCQCLFQILSGHGLLPTPVGQVAITGRSGWRGIQTYVTPRGRETLRLLLEGKPESGLWGFRPPDPPEEMTEAEGIRVERYLTEQARKKRRKQNK